MPTQGARRFLPKKGEIHLEGEGDLDHRLSHYRENDRILRDILSPDDILIEPAITEFDDKTDDDDDTLHDLDPTICADDMETDKQTVPIYVFPDEEAYEGTTPQALILKWHHRLGHVNFKYLRRIAKTVKGMEELRNIPESVWGSMPRCDTCIRAKTKRRKLPFSTFKRAAEEYCRIHSDLSGLISTPLVEGGQYFTVFVDDASNYKWVFVLKNKDAWLEALDSLIVRTGQALKILRTDNAGEMISKRAQQYYAVYRIWHEKCCAHEHHQNPRAESAIGEISRRARALLVNSGVPRRLWSFGVYYACEISNRSLPYCKDSDITCFKKLHGEAPDNTILRRFGCRAYVTVDKKRRDGKWDETVVAGIYLGFAYHLGHKGYVVITDDFKRIFISSDVTFNEGVMPCKPSSKAPSDIYDQGFKDLPGEGLESMSDAGDIDGDIEVIVDTSDQDQLIPAVDPVQEQHTRSQARQRALLQPNIDIQLPAGLENRAPRQEERQAPAEDPRLQEPRRSERLAARAPAQDNSQYFDELPAGESRYFDEMHAYTAVDDDLHHAYTAWVDKAMTVFNNIDRRSAERIATAFMAFNDEPKTFFEACQRRDADEWIKATYEEFQSMLDLDVWEVVDRPKDQHVIKSKIVYKLKLDENNNPKRYKARVVARGFDQVEGVDYFDSFSAMAHPVTVRMLIAAAVANKWSLSHTDVKVAYLNSLLNETVYMEPPPGFARRDGKVLRLRRSIYGLKISGRSWYKLFLRDCKEFGFKPITDDECLLVCERPETGSKLVLLTVVDDCIHATNDTALRDEFLAFLRSKYTITDEGELNWFLGVHYKHLPDGSILANQTAYVDRVLDKFKMQHCKPSKIPMSDNFVITEDDLDPHAPQELIDEYRAKIGCLIYAQIWTRPDIAYATNILARYVTKPSPKLMGAVNKVLRYLKTTRCLGIKFTSHDAKGHGLNVLIAYSDSSDADCHITRRSTGGYSLFYNSNPTSWKSHRQTLCTRSSMESELDEVAATVQEVKHVRSIAEGLGFPQEATPLFVDNQAAIRSSENPCMRSHSKHIGRRYGFVREAVEDKLVMLIYTPTEVNIADIFTKPLSHPQFVYLRTLLMNCTEEDCDASITAEEECEN